MSPASVKTPSLMKNPRKKKRLDMNVWEAGLERSRHAFDIFDRNVVMFSGGKDSTVTLHLALEVAHERNQLPLDVFFYDEEVIPWETVEYVQRVAERDDIRMFWSCMPLTCRNACSRSHPEWWPWGPEDADKWARPMPDLPYVHSYLKEANDAPTPHDRPGLPEAIPMIYDMRDGMMAQWLGIRAAESLTRHRAVTRREEENYISYSIPLYPKMQPIYDWTTEDVWTAVDVFGWDYNAAYDRMEMAGVSHNAQRCAPAFGEQPLNGLWMWAECFPEIWHTMQERVPGVGSAVRYARTELYGNYGRIEKPDGWTWGQFITYWVDKYPPDVQHQVYSRIKQVIARHQRKAGADPILPTAAHPVSWISWRFLAGLAVVADLKERRQEAEGSREDYEAELAALKAKGPKYFREWTQW